MRGPKLQALRAAGQAFLAGLRPRDEVGLLSFSAEVRWLARPTADRAALGRAIDALRAQGATAVWDALFTAISVLPTASRSVVVVFSDGEDNLSWLDGAQLRAHAERSNALVQVVVRSTGEVDLGDPVAGMPGRGGARRLEPIEPSYIRELRQVAETTGGRVWRTDSPASLTAAFAAIVEAMNTRYVLRYEPGPAREARLAQDRAAPAGRQGRRPHAARLLARRPLTMPPDEALRAAFDAVAVNRHLGLRLEEQAASEARVSLEPRPEPRRRPEWSTARSSRPWRTRRLSTRFRPDSRASGA